MTLRQLWLNHRVWGWQVEQAAELGGVRIFMRESRRGPPARMAEIYRHPDAKDPSLRRLNEELFPRGTLSSR